MTKLILCEGKTDAVFLSYYMEIVLGWTHKFPKREIPKGFDVDVDKHKGEWVGWYRKGNDFLTICGVGGKDNFKSFIENKIIPAMVDSSMFSKIAVVTDRDDREEDSICQSFQQVFGAVLSSIENNKWIKNAYKNGFNQEEIMDFLLLIIPPDKEGALETLLIDAIAEHEDDKVIVDKAKAYIDDVEPLGPVPTTASSHLSVNFPPLFVGISLLAFEQAASTPPQLAKSCRESWPLSLVGTGPSIKIHRQGKVKT